MGAHLEQKTVKRLKGEDPDRVDAFKAACQPAVKKLLGLFDELQFFVGEGEDAFEGAVRPLDTRVLSFGPTGGVASCSLQHNPQHCILRGYGYICRSSSATGRTAVMLPRSCSARTPTLRRSAELLAQDGVRICVGAWLVR